MPRSLAAKHLRLALARWPQDLLRPAAQLQDILSKRAAQLETSSSPAAATAEARALREANALYALLDDRFKTRYRVQGALYTPRSRPTYYEDLARELEAAPTRTIWGRMVNRLQGMVRLT